MTVLKRVFFTRKFMAFIALWPKKSGHKGDCITKVAARWGSTVFLSSMMAKNFFYTVFLTLLGATFKLI